MKTPWFDFAQRRIESLLDERQPRLPTAEPPPQFESKYIECFTADTAVAPTPAPLLLWLCAASTKGAFMSPVSRPGK